MTCASYMNKSYHFDSQSSNWVVCIYICYYTIYMSANLYHFINIYMSEDIYVNNYVYDMCIVHE